VGRLSEAKFFMNPFTKSTFVDNLVFEGSNDGNTYTTIFTVSEEIHEGWNYYDIDTSYRWYRFSGSVQGACKIGEIALIGVEALTGSIGAT